MGTFRITVEIADPRGQRFEAVEMLVDTGATFTKAPRDLLERLGVPVESHLHRRVRRREQRGTDPGQGGNPAGGEGVPHTGDLRRGRGTEPPGGHGPGRRYAGSGSALQEADTGRRPAR